ncbi:MAG: hypothetical protein KJ714_04775 [Euryarchaeota archaeon]|nr:hypothetical protein [Euryarchaeota archaeon]
MEFSDRFKRRILLTEERWNHIIETHPELKEMLKELQGTLENPELIKRSVYSENVVLFYGHYEHIYEGKHLCVVVRLDNESIVTAYITDRIKRGEVIWKKN